MPRNAAKKSNTNAKRLPVLIKLINKNINSKKKKVNRKRINSKQRKNNYNKLKETKQKKIQKYNKSNANLKTSNKKQDRNCDSNDNNSIPSSSSSSASSSLTISNKNYTKISKNIKKASKNLTTTNSSSQVQEQQEIIILKSFSKSIDPVKSVKLDESQLKEQKHIKSEKNFVNKKFALNVCNCNSNIIQSIICTSEQEETNLTLTSLSETDVNSSEQPTLSLTPASLHSVSSDSSLSCLYPIVIETSASFQSDNIDKEQQQRLEENDTSSKKKKTHSINNCNSNNNSVCKCCHAAAAAAAVDTLEQHKSQNNNHTCNNNNNNNKIIASTLGKRCNNCNKQKQSTQSSTTTATKVLTLSKPPSSNQSQEVKARLATLRIRKTVSQQQQQSDKTAQRIQKPTPENTSDKDIQISECKDSKLADTGKHFIKKVSPVLDNATLDLIETLSDEVKKPNNKRKRSTTTAVLLATLNQQRPKRIAATLQTQVDKKTTGLTAAAVHPGLDKNDPKQTGANFLKPLPIEATNTNSKKRARIMSLYERPFQSASDSRGGSVVGNGYMTSSRSSASSGGTAGALVMNDPCDTQEMANQYYLSGGSGSGIATNSNQALVGNGSAIIHAPTMGTLCNIGNTCYLNSVVYTLRFAPQFLHNLHHLLADLSALQQNIARARAKSSSLGRGISAVHMENVRSWSSKDLASMEQYATGTAAANPVTPSTNSTALIQVTQKSSHQLLTEKLHELYQSLHRNEITESTEPHHADTLLHAIQDVSSIFEGNQQQDAHEFLMCLLNSIRETSQTLIKAIAECPDVILNGYISNPDEIERDLIKNHTSGASAGMGIAGSNSSNSNSLASASSKTSSFFSRKSKRKDESKNSKNSRLQSPLKDALMSGSPHTTTTANSLFYLNTNDLNATATSPASATSVSGAAAAGSHTSVSNSLSSQIAGAADETDTSTAVALILKDKQRLEGKIKELGLDFFNEDFEGITVSTTKCLSCETITEKKETMIDIAVPVPQAGYESKEVMDKPSSFIQNSCITREYFRNENKYRCEQCCGYTEAIRSISYEVLPRLLIIQLSRFSGGMEKINSYIPTSFTLQCFCSKCCELSDANKLHIYKLYSVITHVGATMSVGHYIAYTSSLEWANEYINCPKEQRRRRASQERNLAAMGNSGSGAASASSSAQSTSTASTGLGTSSTGFMKMKMKFGRSKASSSGDMSKNVKQVNGLSTSSKSITNGIGKLTMNNSSGGSAATPQCPITCQSINCCAMRLTAQQQLQYQSANNSTSDFSEESSQYSNGPGYNNPPANYNNNLNHPFATSANTLGYGSTGRGATKVSYATIQNNCTEPIWYMCDDDKIKAMTQREFEELLSPARKITITPYLLFYARYNLQSTPPKSATASTSSPGPVTSSPQTSWSNESLQSSGHSAHSSGMRM